MRVLHTSDWHLGKRLDYFSRHEEQEAVINEIIQISVERSVDLVVVSGDLFDTYNPPVESVELLYRSLKKLTQNGQVPVVAIAGNHDSPDRVNVADVLARENGIILVGNPTDEVPLFEVENGFRILRSEPGFVEISLPKYPYPVRLLHTAFANEQRLKTYFGEEKQRSLQETLQETWTSLCTRFCDQTGVNLLCSHLFMLKKGEAAPEEPEGEKPINIGTADLIYSDALPREIQYVALGHLHRWQDVGSRQPVVYCGSPLAYSFSEAGQQKYVSLVDLEPGASAQVEQIKLRAGKSLVRKRVVGVDAAVEWLQLNTDCLVELTLETDEFLKAEERKRFYQAHDGIIFLIPQVKNREIQNQSNTQINLNQDMRALFSDYFKSKNGGQAPNDDIINLFNEILNN